MSETNGSSQPKQRKPPIKKAVPVAQSLKKVREATVDQQKAAFITSLKANGGNVSGALEASGLNRNRAYNELKADTEFAAKWQDALEVANDELFVEARRRAVEGEQRFTAQGQAYRDKSDTLLIFLMKQGENRMRWRHRVKQTGNAALESVSTAGAKAGLTEEQIRLIQDDMLTRFDKISLS